LLPPARKGGRKRKYNLRRIVNAIFYFIRTGCDWRSLPRDFPNWSTVYGYFADWSKSGIIEKIHSSLLTLAREAMGKNPQPSVLIVDAQSVKNQFGECRGHDGFKKVLGRKRSIFVDTLGFIHDVRVDSAGVKDHQSAIEMLQKKNPGFRATVEGELQGFIADGGYTAKNFAEAVKNIFKIEPTVMKSKKIFDKNKNLNILLSSNLKPKRWIVERTFAWFGHYRRLVKDYERKTIHSEAVIRLSMINIMLKRLTREGYTRWN